MEEHALQPQSRSARTDLLSLARSQVSSGPSGTSSPDRARDRQDHFCKTEELHEKFVKLLNRIDAEIMLFQAHRHDPPGQMEGAFRNYNEIEFVKFISKHTGLNMWEKLGVAADKRPIYKLWKS